MSFDLLLRQGNLIAVIVLALCVLGLVVAFSVPVQMIPDISTRTIVVETRWPGATPQDIEQEILMEQEQHLRTLPGLRRIISNASSGEARIQLDFPFGTDINEALLRTSNALSRVARYPENVDPPALSTISASEEPFMYFAITPMAGQQLDLGMVRDFIEDEVRPRIERVPGVALVEIMGGAQRQIQIMIDPARLAQRGLDVSAVRDALRMRNTDTSGGDLESGKRRVLVRAIGRFRDVESIKTLIISERDGTVTRLADVAQVRLGHMEQQELAFRNGDPALVLAVRRQAGANVIQTKYAVLSEIEAVRSDVLAPADLDITLFTEDARYVEESVTNVWRALLAGALLATGIMYAFLRSARTTAIGVIAIPICTIAAFVGLLLTGRTLNVVSLAGIAFALGMTVDNAVVVLESIDQVRRRGLGPVAAAVEGAKRVWPAVLACTVATVIVFLPIFFIEEEAGEIFSDIAIAIVAAVIASLVVAVTVVPVLAARWLGAEANAPTVGEDHFDRLGHRLGWFMRTRTRRAAVTGGTVVASFLGLVLLTPPAEYLPEGEEARIFAEMVAPPGYNLTEMERIAHGLIVDLRRQIERNGNSSTERVHGFPPIEKFAMFVGAEGITVVTDPSDPSDVDDLRRALETRMTEIPGMRASTSRGSVISGDDGGTRSINLEVSGNDLVDVYRAAGAAYARAERLFDNAQVSSDPRSLSLDQPMLELRPRWDRLAEVGLDASRFGYSVAAFGDGAFAGEMILDGRRIDIYLFSNAGHAQRLDNLRDQPVATPSGAVLPVSALADFEETVDTDNIRRVDGRRTVTISIVPPRSVALETGIASVRQQLMAEMAAAGEVPDGVTLDITGASDQLDAARRSLFGNLALALFLSYLMLVAVLRHWGLPLFVMATVPLGVAGGLLGLALLNGIGAILETLGLSRIDQPFDMITLLGFLVLLSAVVNNPILIVMEAYEGFADGKPAIEAVQEAVRLRLRPILMSTYANVIGLLPMVVLPGAGTELYRGLGAVMLSGIIISTIVTVTFLPCLLIFVFNLEWFRVERNR